MKQTTKEITRDGFDLVLTPEYDGWTASIYRHGKQIPLRRKLVESEEKALKWFDLFLSRRS